MLTHKGTKTIETERLILRPACAEDAEPMFANWASDPDVTKFLTWPTHESVDVSRFVVESWATESNREDYYQWMIVLKALNEPIGSISVVDMDERIKKAEIGYCIGKAWWGKGIMSEALSAVMEFLFREVGMNRIEARHDANNPASGRVMKKCGMVYEGTARQYGWNNQGVCDICSYAVLREDWEAVNKKVEHYV